VGIRRLLVFPTIVSAKFTHGAFLDGTAWLSIGRLRPLHLNGVREPLLKGCFLGRVS